MSTVCTWREVEGTECCLSSFFLSNAGDGEAKWLRHWTSNTVQFNSVPWLTGSLVGHKWQFSRDPFLFLFCFCFLWKAIISSPDMEMDVNSLMLSIQRSISSSSHSINHPPRRPEEGFWRCCRQSKLVHTAFIDLLHYAECRKKVIAAWPEVWHPHGDVGDKKLHLKMLVNLMVWIRSCLIWPSLPLLSWSWCRFLLSRCHPCTCLLPGT